MQDELAGGRPRFRRPLAVTAAPDPAALGSQPRGRGGGGGGAGISLGAALTAPLCRSPSGGARWAAQSAFVRAVSHRITRIMRPPGPGRRAGRHRVATGGSRGRAAPPAPAPGRAIPLRRRPPPPRRAAPNGQRACEWRGGRSGRGPGTRRGAALAPSARRGGPRPRLASPPPAPRRRALVPSGCPPCAPSRTAPRRPGRPSGKAHPPGS